MNVLLFLEDAAHLGLLRTLVARVAADEAVQVDIEARNAVGGSGKTLSALKNYVRDLAAGQGSFAEILVVAIDGNCHGANERAGHIQSILSGADYSGRAVFAVPDPHVEVWYMADGSAVGRVAGGIAQAPLPEYKCERNRYKNLLREVFTAAGVSPPLGGSEFGDEIGIALDLEAARRSQDSLDRFLSQLRAALKELRAAGL